MDLRKLSREHRDIGESIIFRTSRKYSGRLGGNFNLLSDKTRDISERLNRVLLRVGFELLVKSLYLKEGYNIYKLRNNPKSNSYFTLMHSFKLKMMVQWRY